MVAPAGTGPEGTGPGTPAPPPEGEVASRRLGWIGVGLAALGFLCGLLVSGIVAGTYAGVRGFDQADAEGDLAFTLLSALGVWVGFLLVPLVWAWRRGGPRRVLGLAGRWVDIPLGLGVGLAATIVTAVVSGLTLTGGEQEELESIAREQIDRAHGVVAVGLLVLALCVVTPVAEEVFFRGLLLRSLHRLAGLVTALAVMGMVFGLLHYQFEPMPGRVVLVQIGMLSLFGITLGLLAHRTGRLGASIMAHATFNAVTVVSLLAQR